LPSTSSGSFRRWKSSSAPRAGAGGDDEAESARASANSKNRSRALQATNCEARARWTVPAVQARRREPACGVRPCTGSGTSASVTRGKETNTTFLTVLRAVQVLESRFEKRILSLFMSFLVNRGASRRQAQTHTCSFNTCSTLPARVWLSWSGSRLNLK
jgi:hypothetical protein